MRAGSVVRAGLLAAVVVVAVSCLFPTETGEQYRIEFTTPPGLLFLGDTASVAAVVVDADGAPRPDITVNYRSGTRAIVDVDARTGLMRGVKEGAASIMAFAPGWEGAVPASDTVRVLVGSGSGILSYGPRAVRFGDTVTVVGSDLDPNQFASLVFGGVGYGASEIVHRFAQGDRDTLVLWILPPAPTATSLLLVREAGSAVVLPLQVEQTDVLEPNGDDTPRRLAAPFRNPALAMTGGDVDVYEVPVGAGMDVSVTLTAEVASSVELSVRRASSGSAIWPASNRVLCRGANVFGETRDWELEEQRVALRQSTADTLILRIVGREIAPGQHVRYGLAVDTTYLAAAAIDETEENDWCEAGLRVPTAVPGDTVAPTDTTLVLTFDNAPDPDWIRLDLDRPRVVKVWADPNGAGPVPDLYLFRQSADTLLLRGQRAAHDAATADLDSLALSIPAGPHALLVTNAAVGEPGEATGAYTIRVRTERPIIESVTVQSGPVRIRSGLTTRLDAEARDQLGEVVDVGLVWASTDTSVATVLPTGLVTAHIAAEGTASALITVRSAEFPDAADSVPITVERDDIVWTWVGGRSTPDQPGVYGTRGVPSATNLPGARAGAASWVDANGHLWLFGGLGWDGLGNPGALNDVWRFDGTEWTWVAGSALADRAGVYGVKGQPDPANTPGGRVAAVSWIDSNGDLWLFGGFGAGGATGNGYLHDLWRFDGTDWTWVAGSSSVNVQSGVEDPGGRSGAVGWIDAQDGLWVFGGRTNLASWRNDLWRFDGTSWERRSDNLRFGDYVALGAIGYPGERHLGAVWQDADGDVWLFGGEGQGFHNNQGLTSGRLSDLWRWDGSVFRWIAGPKEAGHEAVYGLGVATDSTDPGGLTLLPVSWTGADGSLWLFGGEGQIEGVSGINNDLWRFDGARWAWMAGSAGVKRNPVFGTMGVGSVDNTPGARSAAVSWTDAAGNLWMFGGGSFGAGGTERYWNDLWRIEP